MGGSSLELVIETDANHVVCAAVGLGSLIRGAHILVLLLGVVGVETAEVADVEAHLLVDVPGAAESETVAVAGKGGVLLIFVGQSVVSALTTTADGELLVDVVLDTSEDLVCAVLQCLLSVVCHLGVLVVEEVVLQRSAKAWGELVADSYGEPGVPGRPRCKA